MVQLDSPARNTRSRTRARGESEENAASSPTSTLGAANPSSVHPTACANSGSGVPGPDSGCELVLVGLIRILMVLTNIQQLLIVVGPSLMSPLAHWAAPIPRIAAAACVIYWGVAESVFRTKKGKNRLSETPHDQGTSVVCSFCVILLHNLPLILMWIQGSGEAMQHPLPFTFKQFHTQPAWYVLPLLLTASALALRWLSIYTLGDFFSRALAIFDGHQIVDTGIYSIIRHPGYLGNFVLFISSGLLICGNPVLLLIMIVIFFSAWHIRMNVEENMLITAKQQAYKDYMKRVPFRLIPGIY